MCHISINTLRKEIDIINDFLQPYGCHIDTKISIGYSIIIDDESIARPFLFRLLKEINRYSYLNISSSQKENYIIRRLLTSSRPIALDTLINELYYSKSTILRNIDKIKDYLKLFNLEIKVKRKEGFYIDGKEWNKRMCLIHQHKIYTHSRYDALNVDLSEDQSFINTFLTDTDYSNKLKTLFLSIAPNYPTLSFAHIDLAMIFNFIILCKTRHDKSNELFFTEEQLNYVHNSTTYALAKEMIDSIPSYFLIDFTQNEIDAFAILLEGIRKYNNPNYFTSTELISLREETMNLLMFISERYYIDDIIDEQLILDLCCFIKEHKLLHLFEIYKDDESFTFINRSGIFTSDLCARIALYLDKNANMPLNLDFISRVYSIFNRALYENRVFFKSQNFLVISFIDVFNSRCDIFGEICTITGNN